jgi:hypothetical protein
MPVEDADLLYQRRRGRQHGPTLPREKERRPKKDRANAVEDGSLKGLSEYKLQELLASIEGSLVNAKNRGGSTCLTTPRRSTLLAPRRERMARRRGRRDRGTTARFGCNRWAGETTAGGGVWVGPGRAEG